MMHGLDNLFYKEAYCEHIYFGLVLIRLQEIDLCEVHSYGVRNKGLQKFHHEGQRDSLRFRGTGRCEFTSIDAVDVEGDPVGLFMAIREEVLLYLTFHIWDPIWVANSGIVPWNPVFLYHFDLFGLVGPNAEIY